MYLGRYWVDLGWIWDVSGEEFLQSASIVRCPKLFNPPDATPLIQNSRQGGLGVRGGTMKCPTIIQQPTENPKSDSGRVDSLPLDPQGGFGTPKGGSVPPRGVWYPHVGFGPLTDFASLFP